MGTPQLSFALPVTLPANAYDYGDRTSGETHGVVLTKPEVVNLILDLAGYAPDRDLARLPLLEPSCGHGAFLVQAVERLMCSAKAFKRDATELAGAISAFDIEPGHVELTRDSVARVLRRHGIGKAASDKLVNGWIVCADFLLAPQERRFEFVVGNPPYIRIEQLDPALQDEYRRRYETLFDRADLYVAFIEHGLNLLAKGGVLAFICADRWILNKYGAPLRKLLADRFSVRSYIDLHRASPFASDVIAYPSIFAISPGTSKRVCVGALETASPEECRAVLPMIAAARDGSAPGVTVSVYDSWFEGGEPWVISTPAHLKALRELENQFEPMENAGAKVGIGVATGCDDIYIVDENADIEPDRLVPLVMRADIERGHIRDGRRFVINAFGKDGRVVDLAEYPRLARYLHANSANVRKRHVAQKNPGSWFRTIDRVYPELVGAPKLLIPDIAGSNEVVLDEGRFHPHHNLYFVTSPSWDMRVLGALLSSKVALFFIWSYAVKMRGGYLRFQAQYLRRICLPEATAIRLTLAMGLAAAFENRDFAKIDELALEAYGLRALPHFEFVDTRS